MNYKQFIETHQLDYFDMLGFTNESYFEISDYLFSNDNTDTQFVMKKVKDDWFISFRGTSSVKDVMIDINCDKQTIAYDNNDSPIRIHEGFYNSYRSVRNIIHEKIRDSHDEYSKVFISGHSLGGALAVLCSIDLLYNFSNLRTDTVFILTIGQPKVGNQAFADSTNERLDNYYRIVNGDDVVPKFPAGYKHCGELVEIGEKHWYKSFSITDHLQANYLSLLFSKLPAVCRNNY